MWKQMGPAARMTAALTVVTGLLYPGLVTGLCQGLFPGQANGSLLRREGRVIGSRLIGQRFTRPEYVHPRPSAAGAEGYDAMASGGSNLGPASRKLHERVAAAVAAFRAENPEHAGPVPAELVTASASGLDPEITPAGVRAQAARVAKARQMPAAAVEALAAEFTSGPAGGLLGESRVNVLLLNLALDERHPVGR